MSMIIINIIYYIIKSTSEGTGIGWICLSYTEHPTFKFAFNYKIIIITSNIMCVCVYWSILILKCSVWPGILVCVAIMVT